MGTEVGTIVGFGISVSKYPHHDSYEVIELDTEGFERQTRIAKCLQNLGLSPANQRKGTQAKGTIFHEKINVILLRQGTQIFKALKERCAV